MLLTVGRLIERKGVLWFLDEVFTLVVARHPACRYEIVGDGPQRAAIEDSIREHGWEERVRLHPDASDAEKEKIVARADVFVAPDIAVPGDMEGFGIVCLEAAACGVPVAAARLDGLADAVVKGETGSFFEPSDASGCAACVDLLLSSPPSSDAMRAAPVPFEWPRLLMRYHDEAFHA